MWIEQKFLKKRALVNRTEYAKLNGNKLLNWVNKYWVPEVGYASRVCMLVNGWIACIFIDEDKVETILNNGMALQ